jgi:hypothetical protein
MPVLFKNAHAKYECSKCETPMQRSFVVGLFSIKSLELFLKDNKCSCGGHMDLISIRAAVDPEVWKK